MAATEDFTYSYSSLQTISRYVKENIQTDEEKTNINKVIASANTKAVAKKSPKTR